MAIPIAKLTANLKAKLIIKPLNIIRRKHGQPIKAFIKSIPKI